MAFLSKTAVKIDIFPREISWALAIIQPPLMLFRDFMTGGLGWVKENRPTTNSALGLYFVIIVVA